LSNQRESGRYYAAICASPAVVFQTHGLLKDKKATCYPVFTEQLENTSEAGARIVVDGNCITSQGPGTALEFAIELIRQLFDDTTAQQVADAMLTR
jgi:4-methyl-5(b-hydroxyethyl)-thiazole monophosphate biosynthesis